MTVTQVRRGRHRCPLPDPLGWVPGDVVACDDCGRWWRNVQPGNPHYAKWVRAWIRQAVERAKR